MAILANLKRMLDGHQVPYEVHSHRTAMTAAAGRPEVTGFFDSATNTVSHVAVDPATRKCALIDSVLDYDPASGRTDRHSADRMMAFVRGHGLDVDWVLETHVHAAASA